MTNEAIFNKIMNLEGSDDIKAILRRWRNFSMNKSRFSQSTPIVLPDMLWVVKSGYGKTNLLSLISEYLSEEGLMEFYGDVKFFEFDCEYHSSEGRYDAFGKFTDMIMDAAGFRSEFRGVVCININEWIYHLKDMRFHSFLDYLSEKSDVWHIIFSTDCADNNLVRDLEALLSVYFRIEKVRFSIPEPEYLVEYMEGRLKEHNFTLDGNAKTILLDTVKELMKSKYFDGYKTLNMICADLIYREISSDEFNGYVISEETVRYYSKDSEFVKRTKTNIEKRKTIGFVNEGGNGDDK